MRRDYFSLQSKPGCLVFVSLIGSFCCLLRSISREISSRFPHEVKWLESQNVIPDYLSVFPALRWSKRLAARRESLSQNLRGRKVELSILHIHWQLTLCDITPAWLPGQCKYLSVFSNYWLPGPSASSQWGEHSKHVIDFITIIKSFATAGTDCWIE